MKAPDGMHSSDVLIDELYETTLRIRLHVDAQLRPHALSVARLRALRALAASPEPLRMTDLSRLLDLAARTVTTMVDALEREGLAERVRHPADRRALLVRLTDLGRARHAEAEEIDRAALATVTGGLDAGERARLRELLARLRDAVADQPAG